MLRAQQYLTNPGDFASGLEAFELLSKDIGYLEASCEFRRDFCPVEELAEAKELLKKLKALLLEQATISLQTSQPKTGLYLL